MAMDILSLSKAVTLPLRLMTLNRPGAVAAILVESVGMSFRGDVECRPDCSCVVFVSILFPWWFPTFIMVLLL
jgi:hypothetical protein